MDEFEILITDTPDRENLVAEIWFKDNLICELNMESHELEIKFYQSVVDRMNYSIFLDTLKKAKKKLLGNTI